MGITLTCESCGNSPSVTPRPPWPNPYICMSCRMSKQAAQDTQMAEDYDKPVKYSTMAKQKDRENDIARMVRIGIGDR